MQDLVTCVGQPLGIVAADTEEQARAAAAAVVVEYEDLPAILDIEDAIAGKYPACTAAAGSCCSCCLPLLPATAACNCHRCRCRRRRCCLCAGHSSRRAGAWPQMTGQARRHG